MSAIRGLFFWAPLRLPEVLFIIHNDFCFLCLCRINIFVYLCMCMYISPRSVPPWEAARAVRNIYLQSSYCNRYIRFIVIYAFPLCISLFLSFFHSFTLISDCCVPLKITYIYSNISKRVYQTLPIIYEF